MTPKERLEHLVGLTMEAWDKTVGHDLRKIAGSAQGLDVVAGGLRVEFQAAVRERLAQGVQVMTVEAHEREYQCQDGGRKLGLLYAIGECERRLQGVRDDEETPEWVEAVEDLLRTFRVAHRVKVPR